MQATGLLFTSFELACNIQVVAFTPLFSTRGGGGSMTEVLKRSWASRLEYSASGIPTPTPEVPSPVHCYPRNAGWDNVRIEIRKGGRAACLAHPERTPRMTTWYYLVFSLERGVAAWAFSHKSCSARGKSGSSPSALEAMLLLGICTLPPRPEPRTRREATLPAWNRDDRRGQDLQKSGAWPSSTTDACANAPRIEGHRPDGSQLPITYPAFRCHIAEH